MISYFIDVRRTNTIQLLLIGNVIVDIGSLYSALKKIIYLIEFEDAIRRVSSTTISWCYKKTRFIGIRSPTKQDGWRHGDISRMERLKGTNSFMSMCI